MIWKTKNYKGEPMTWYSYDEVADILNQMHYLRSQLEIAVKEKEFYEQLYLESIK